MFSNCKSCYFHAKFTHCMADKIQTCNLPLACNLLYYYTRLSDASILNLSSSHIILNIIWGPERIQIKELYTTKIYNFSKYTTFILILSSSEVVYKIWVLTLKNQTKFLLTKWFQIKKLLTIKFHNWLLFMTLILIDSSSEVV